MNRTIHCEHTGHHFPLAGCPRRIVSLLPSATESLARMGCISRVAGVSEYCSRYVEHLDAPVIGQYLNADISTIRALKPDLVITTSGIQLKLARRLAASGLPVYVIPLPRGLHGILENILILGGLVNELPAAHTLIGEMREKADLLRTSNPVRKPKVYAELWLGRHMRAVGGGSFIRDLIDLAGGTLLFGDAPQDYFTPDFDAVAALQPDIHLFFHEPEYLIDPNELVRERNWKTSTPVIISTVKCGENLIQDGPSLLDTAAWLQRQIHPSA